jgi:hypothetical protein
MNSASERVAVDLVSGARPQAVDLEVLVLGRPAGRVDLVTVDDADRRLL